MSLRKFEGVPVEVHNNYLVDTDSKSLFPYGDLTFKSSKDIYPPNLYLINSCYDHVQSKLNNEKVLEDE